MSDRSRIFLYYRILREKERTAGGAMEDGGHSGRCSCGLRMALEDEKEAGIPKVGIPGRDGETV